MLSQLKKIWRKIYKKTKIQDDFLARLRCTLIGEGMIGQGNIQAFEHVIREIPPDGLILEIGCFGGMSTNILCYFLRKYHKNPQFFGADPWVYQGFHDTARAHDPTYMNYMDGSNRITRQQYTDFVKEAFIRHTLFFSPENLPYTIETTSDNFFEKWKNQEVATDVFGRETKLGGKFNFVYIDGNHDFDYAKRDFENAYFHLAENGFILLDDSADGSQYGSATLTKHIAKSYPDLSIISQTPHYLYQKISQTYG